MFNSSSIKFIVGFVVIVAASFAVMVYVGSLDKELQMNSGASAGQSASACEAGECQE